MKPEHREVLAMCDRLQTITKDTGPLSLWKERILRIIDAAGLPVGNFTGGSIPILAQDAVMYAARHDASTWSALVEQIKRYEREHQPPTESETQSAKGKVAELASQVIDGDTCYYFRLTDTNGPLTTGGEKRDPLFIANGKLSPFLPFLQQGSIVHLSYQRKAEAKHAYVTAITVED